MDFATIATELSTDAVDDPRPVGHLDADVERPPLGIVAESEASTEVGIVIGPKTEGWDGDLVPRKFVRPVTQIPIHNDSLYGRSGGDGAVVGVEGDGDQEKDEETHARRFCRMVDVGRRIGQ